MTGRKLDHLFDKSRLMWRRAWWALGVTWSADKKLLSWLIFNKSVQTIIPLGLALTTLNVVNDVVALIDGSTDDKTK